MNGDALVTAPIGIVSGSGIELEPLLDTVTDERSFDSFPGLAHGTVVGHGHKFVFGQCQGFPVILQSGRLHMYEGLDYEGVTRPVDILYELGARTIVFTNAAGGLTPELQPGDIVGVDCVRLFRYRHWPMTPGTLHPDFVLDNVDLTGMLQWVVGPCYETRAEIRAFQQMKAKAVGMSVGPELARCQDLGMRAAVLSCITNACFSGERLTHEQVVAVAGRTSAKLQQLIRESLSKLA